MRVRDGCPRLAVVLLAWWGCAEPLGKPTAPPANPPDAAAISPSASAPPALASSSAATPAPEAPEPEGSCLDPKRERGDYRWSATTNRLFLECSIQGTGQVLEVLEFPSRRRIARLWGVPLWRLVAVRTDGGAVILQSGRSALSLWDTTSKTLSAFNALPVGAVRFDLSGDFQRIASQESSGRISIHSATDGRLLATIRSPSKKEASDFLLQEDGSSLLTINEEALEIFDTSTGALRVVHKIQTGWAVEEAAWSSSGQRIGYLARLDAQHGKPTGVTSKEVRVWNAGTNREIFSAPAAAFALSRDGTTLWTSEFRKLTRHDLRSKKRRDIFSRGPAEEGEYPLYTRKDLRVSPDGAWILTTLSMMSGHKVELFDATGAQARTGPG